MAPSGRAKGDAPASGSPASSSSSSGGSEGSWFEGGRVKFGGALATGFRAFSRCVVDGALEGPGDDAELLARLAGDCEVAFTARALDASTTSGEDKGGGAAGVPGTYSAGETFWVGAGDAPRCALERLALGVFAYHARGAICDPNLSGAEWWTQCVEEDDEIGFHWDMDYDLVDEACLHPQLATVTYLSGGGGAPTLCLDKVTAWSPEDSVAGDVSRGWLSGPALGKHISFDGRWLHGAPTALRDAFQGKERSKGKRKRGQEAGRRVTFLVNVWLNHRPDDCTPLPDAACRKMRVPVDAAGLRFSSETSHIPVAECRLQTGEKRATASTSPSSTSSFPFRHCGRDLALDLALPSHLMESTSPLSDAQAGTDANRVIQLEFQPGAAHVKELGNGASPSRPTR